MDVRGIPENVKDSVTGTSIQEELSDSKQEPGKAGADLSNVASPQIIEDLKDLIKPCLDINPDERQSFKDLLDHE